MCGSYGSCAARSFFHFLTCSLGQCLVLFLCTILSIVHLPLFSFPRSETDTVFLLYSILHRRSINSISYVLLFSSYLHATYFITPASTSHHGEVHRLQPCPVRLGKCRIPQHTVPEGRKTTTAELHLSHTVQSLSLHAVHAIVDMHCHVSKRHSGSFNSSTI